MHFKPEEISLVTPEFGSKGCVRSAKPGELEVVPRNRLKAQVAGSGA